MRGSQITRSQTCGSYLSTSNAPKGRDKGDQNGLGILNPLHVPINLSITQPLNVQVRPQREPEGERVDGAPLHDPQQYWPCILLKKQGRISAAIDNYDG